MQEKGDKYKFNLKIFKFVFICSHKGTLALEEYIKH